VDDPELGVDVVRFGLSTRSPWTSQDGRASSVDVDGPSIGAVIERDIVTATGRVDGIEAVETELVFDPPWSP
jgi:metal-sulfur cluster biosynthetic enzyme